MNADEKIEELKRKNKGKYLTQGVSFNKECPRQMELLRYALSNSVSFSGLVKEMLALRFDGTPKEINIVKDIPKKKNIGNFI